MAGKNHTEISFRILVDNAAGAAQNLSGDLVPGSLTGGGLVFDQVELTGVSETVKNFLAGHAESPISGKFHMNDTATTGSFTVLTGNDGGTGTVTLQWGQNGAAPTTGDPEWEGEYVYLGPSVSPEGGKAVLNMNWQPTGSTAPAWGTV